MVVRRLYNATLVIFGLAQFSSVPNDFSSRWGDMNAVTVVVQLWVNNSRSRSTQARVRIGTRSTEGNKRSACEEKHLEKNWDTGKVWTAQETGCAAGIKITCHARVAWPRENFVRKDWTRNQAEQETPKRWNDRKRLWKVLEYNNGLTCQRRRTFNS
jgi:hypothetical protein